MFSPSRDRTGKNLEGKKTCLLCPPAEQLEVWWDAPVSRGWAFAGWHRRCQENCYLCAIHQAAAISDLAVRMKFGWACCVTLGPKESLGVPSEGPALLFKW